MQSSKDDTLIKQSWLFCALLMPLVASCSPPPGRYQQATVSTSDGRLCFGVPDTRETRSAPPEIVSIAVSEVGHGLYPLWERIFVDESIHELVLPPHQCIPYASVSSAAPPLQVGTYYEVALSGYTPGNPDNEGEGEMRSFISCFHLRQSSDRTRLEPVMVVCGNVPTSSLPAS